MARLRTTADEDPDARLARRGPNVWLSADEIERLSELWVQIEECATWADQQALRKSAYRMFHAAWSHSGTVDELLELWAEERRWSACCAWAKEGRGRSALEFTPFTQHRV